MDRKKFFSAVRASVFSGSLTAPQVAGMELLLDACAKFRVADDRHVAYVLATPTVETGFKFQPIAENLNYSSRGLLKTFSNYFNSVQALEYARQPVRIANRAYANRMDNGNESSGDGFRFRGRGFCQITGRRNYTLFAKLLGVDLVGNPDLALQPAIAAQIAAVGMRDGVFTGACLGTYFTPTKTDWVRARRIINGSDRAAEIGRHARSFHAALVGASK